MFALFVCKIIVRKVVSSVYVVGMSPDMCTIRSAYRCTRNSSRQNTYNGMAVPERRFGVDFDNNEAFFCNTRYRCAGIIEQPSLKDTGFPLELKQYFHHSQVILFQPSAQIYAKKRWKSML